MASRVTLLSLAAASLSAFAFTPTAFAQSKKSIYDEDDDQDINPLPGTIDKAPHVDPPTEALTKYEVVNGVTVRSTDFLEKYVSIGRNWLYKHVESGKDELNKGLNQYLKVERNVTSTVADLKSDNEDLLPGAIYIMVATLSGSIVARNRSIVLRALSPLLFGVAAFGYFLPQTYSNTGKLIWHFEQRVPAIAKAHIDTRKSIDDLVSSIDSAATDANVALESTVSKTRKFVADTTGIQIPGDKKN